jgi:hypothetical protein
MIRFKAGKNEFAGFKRKQFNNSEKIWNSEAAVSHRLSCIRFWLGLGHVVLPRIDTDCLIHAAFWGHFVGCPIIGVPTACVMCKLGVSEGLRIPMGRERGRERDNSTEIGESKNSKIEILNRHA